MSVIIEAITYDCVDPQRLAEFWAAVTGFRVQESRTGWAAITALPPKTSAHALNTTPPMCLGPDQQQLGARQVRVTSVSAPTQMS